jgi:glycosyltransferase involved in cell wall biosynthesis
VTAPAVSVVVPVYNGNRHLGAALDSVLGQTRPPTEVLVIDDGSSGPPDVVLAGYAERVRLHRQENRGPASARNLGIERSAGEFLAFIDQDDLWTPDKLALQLARFAAEPSLDLCFGHVELFWEPALRAEERAHRQHPRGQRVPGYTTPALLARRTAFERVGALDAGLWFGDAADWTMRARAAGLRIAMLPEVVLRHRMHEKNLTRHREASKREFVHIVRTHLDRQRKPGSRGASGGAGTP